MEKILGIDLGTNSIGLALRNGSEFEWFGVYTFKKGVGTGKSGEFSFAAERTKHRSSRRLNNARRYRKWETLRILIENHFCPLTIDELNKWKYYEKGIGRVFPVNNEEFNNWIKLDFNNDNKPDYSSPYQLRKELINETLDITNQINLYKIGRALYHIAQRRGFKSSRKSGDNEKTSVYEGSSKTKTIGRNEYETLIDQKGSLGAAFAYLQDEGLRVRNRYTLRSDYLKEVKKIIKIQKLDTIFEEDITKAIFYQRPLRSQKGLIGKCTLEKNKYRCPVSHPKYEEFRAWSFINTIKYRNNDSDVFLPIPFELKQKIYDDVFFRKSKANFKFIDIRNYIKKNGGNGWELNYKTKLDNTNVSGCPVSARLKSVFGKNWKTMIIESQDLKKNSKERKKKITYNFEDIWHILFSYEDEEVFREFALKKLQLEDEKVDELTRLFNKFPVGYANLSLKAITNILPFLEKGLIYTESVLLAKIPELIGKSIFQQNNELVTNSIKDEIEKNRIEKQRLNIVNTLIGRYFSDFQVRRAKGVDDYIREIAISDIKALLPKYFGKKHWLKKEDIEKKEIYEFVVEKYLCFLDGNQTEEEKASKNTPEIDYYKMPHLLDQIKLFLSDNFDLSNKKLSKMYHPSQISIYAREDNQDFLKSPKTGAFKNPMAYKTLYRLRDVINHLIEIGIIDNETKIVVEIARDLNDKNKRSAFEIYQRKRELENKEFAIAITELVKDPEFKGAANPNSKTDKDKFRLWTEQINNKDEIVNTIIATKDDVKKYRLWKEQNCICFYTGRTIKLTDLFNPNIIDFEHTIPRSKSFDNSLANMTVCYADYNRNIKKNKIPTELDNYEEGQNGYQPIKPHLKRWVEKVEKIEKEIDFWKFKSRIAIDKESKDKAIREKHLRYFEYEYWKNKVDRFTRIDIPQGFVNSQLRDTQIITKYAYHYLKTVFSKVIVQKGQITAEFRKIYGIQEKNEVKSRTKHYHHAIDAAVLTLIPESSKREDILKRAYEYSEENFKQYHEKPFSSFKNSVFSDIEKELLINNIPNKDQALTPSKRIVRKRGRVVWLRNKKGEFIKDKDGNKVLKYSQGQSIRGQLHQETFYGRIKVVKRDKNKKPLRSSDNEWQYETKNDGFRFVLRVPIEKITDLDKIVDPYIAEMISKQKKGRSLAQTIASGVWMLNNKGEKENKIRRVRCWVRNSNLLQVKEQTYKSKYSYKNYYYADTGDNYAFALYISKDGKKKVISRNLFEVSTIAKEVSIGRIEDLFEPSIKITKTKLAKLYHVFQVGQKVLFYEDTPNGLKDLDNLSDRLYYVHTLFDAKQGLIKFQHHLEARNDEQLGIDFPKETFGQRGKNGFSKFTTDFVQPRLLLSPNNLNCLIENKDFTFSLDGNIKFLL